MHASEYPKFLITALLRFSHRRAPLHCDHHSLSQHYTKSADNLHIDLHSAQSPPRPVRPSHRRPRPPSFRSLSHITRLSHTLTTTLRHDSPTSRPGHERRRASSSWPPLPPSLHPSSPRRLDRPLALAHISSFDAPSRSRSRAQPSLRSLVNLPPPTVGISCQRSHRFDGQ